MIETPPLSFSSDEAYRKHLKTAHNSSTIGEARKMAESIAMNTPKPLPPGITPDALPSAEFLKQVAEMEQRKNTVLPPPPIKVDPPIAVVQDTVKPLELTYVYQGTDALGHGVNTLEIDVAEKHFCIAYCPVENKQIESREVVDLKRKEASGHRSNSKTFSSKTQM